MEPSMYLAGEAAANSPPSRGRDGGGRNRRRREGKGRRHSLENYQLSVSKTEKGMITLCAEACGGVWVPGAGLGHLRVPTWNLREGRGGHAWVLCCLWGTSQQPPERQADPRACLLETGAQVAIFSPKCVGRGVGGAKTPLPRPKPLPPTFCNQNRVPPESPP